MKKKISIFIFLLFVICLLSFFLIHFINQKITPIVMEYSIGEMKRVASTIINRSITSEMLEKARINDLFIVSKSNSDEVISVTLDSRIVNDITDKISDACEDHLRLIEEGEYTKIKKQFNIGEEYFFVPSGIIFQNTLLNNLGPKIPITLKMVGNVTSGITCDVKEYGINNSLITVSVEIKVELMVILPLSTKEISITNYVPIAIKLVQGKVPQIYGGSLVN